VSESEEFVNKTKQFKKFFFVVCLTSKKKKKIETQILIRKILNESFTIEKKLCHALNEERGKIFRKN
jgi:hypothetical protein